MMMVAIGFLSGIISGMGIGGGTILIPALVFLEGMGQQEVQIINLIYFIPTALIALYFHNKNNLIEKKILKPIILTGFIGAVVGSFIATSLDGDILRKIFGVFLAIMGIVEIRKK